MQQSVRSEIDKEKGQACPGRDGNESKPEELWPSGILKSSEHQGYMKSS